MSARRPYKRSMDGWWRRNPFFVEYMIHEGTAFFVAIYALILLVGVMKLADGQAAWETWVQWLTSPFAIILHVILLAGFLYHTWTWFNIMPRTLPPIMVDGKRVGPATITGTGLAAACGASLLLLIVCWSLAR